VIAELDMQGRVLRSNHAPPGSSLFDGVSTADRAQLREMIARCTRRRSPAYGTIAHDQAGRWRLELTATSNRTLLAIWMPMDAPLQLTPPTQQRAARPALTLVAELEHRSLLQIIQRSFDQHQVTTTVWLSQDFDTRAREAGGSRRILFVGHGRHAQFFRGAAPARFSDCGAHWTAKSRQAAVWTDDLNDAEGPVAKVHRIYGELDRSARRFLGVEELAQQSPGERLAVAFLKELSRSAGDQVTVSQQQYAVALAHFLRTVGTDFLDLKRTGDPLAAAP